MCEIFGLTAKRKNSLNSILTTFFSHSDEHPNGWGLVLPENDKLSINKEPVKALDSVFLAGILSHEINASKCIAHIRRATIGDVNVLNAHPFIRYDKSGRQWILVHNGTIFESEILDQYHKSQEGTTDSERILLYIIDEINKQTNTDDINVRIRVIENVINTIVPGNKLNLLIHDGEYFYIHKNEEGTLFRKVEDESVTFATKPLDNGTWEELPPNRLFVYKEGELIYQGSPHSHTYVHDEEQMKLLYLAYSGL